MRRCVDLDLDLDDEQPLTLEAWIARQKAELSAARLRAHAELDALFDQQQRRMELDAEMIRRDLLDAPQH